MTVAEANIWDQQQGETDAPYAAFVRFRDEPIPRNISRLAKEIGYKPDTLYQWSSDFCWQERATLWDAHLQRIADKAKERALEDKATRMARRQLRIAGKVHKVAEKKLDAIISGAQTGTPLDREVTVRDAIRGAKEATNIERLVTGEATERVETAQKIDFSKATPEQLAVLAKAEEILKLLGGG